jgi:phosphoheptose isomerase
VSDNGRAHADVSPGIDDHPTEQCGRVGHPHAVDLVGVAKDHLVDSADPMLEAQVPGLCDSFGSQIGRVGLIGRLGCVGLIGRGMTCRQGRLPVAGAWPWPLLTWVSIAIVVADSRLLHGPRAGEAIVTAVPSSIDTHHARHRHAVDAVAREADTLRAWAQRLLSMGSTRSTLLIAGNGGSAAQAQHLAAELVGRFGRDRAPMSAISLTADGAILTAILNDYGPEEVFSRQVTALGRPNDVLLLISTSGHSPNVIEAARAGRAGGMRVWALTGQGPNPLVDLADEAITVPCDSTAAVQEAHLFVVHAICGEMEELGA